eukprot:jgi/Mesvir1/5905/Mv00675-RA.1
MHTLAISSASAACMSAPSTVAQNSGTSLQRQFAPASKHLPGSAVHHFAARPRLTSKCTTRQQTVCLADLGNVSPAVYAAASLGLSALGVVGYKTYAYFQMQYITAAMMSKFVPRGGARAIQLGLQENARQSLFYYPSDLQSLIGVHTAPLRDPELNKKIALEAGVPLDMRRLPFNKLNVPANYADAVVTLHGLEQAPDALTEVLAEAARVLKPGKPLVFVERVKGDGAFLGGLLHSGPQCTNFLETLKACDGFEAPEYDLVFAPQDPHVVGIAKKKSIPGVPIDTSLTSKAKKRDKKA